MEKSLRLIATVSLPENDIYNMHACMQTLLTPYIYNTIEPRAYRLLKEKRACKQAPGKIHI
jgi:hypothetical protein